MIELEAARLIAKGRLSIDIQDAATGQLLEHQEYDNLTVTAGRNLIRDFLNGDSVTGLTKFALGTDSTAATAGQTTLFAEAHRGNITQKTKGTGALTLKYYMSSSAGNGSTYQEAALFGNGATEVANSGTMYARAVITALAKTASIAVTWTWELTWEVI